MKKKKLTRKATLKLLGEINEVEKDILDCKVRHNRVSELMEEVFKWESSPDEADGNLIHDIYSDMAFYKDHLEERWDKLLEQRDELAGHLHD